jgi:hypothetical protein
MARASVRGAPPAAYAVPAAALPFGVPGGWRPPRSKLREQPKTHGSPTADRRLSMSGRSIASIAVNDNA